MEAVIAEDGRAGDIWRIEGKDHLVRIEQLNKNTVTLNSVTDPQPSGAGFELGRWDDVIYRVREDLTQAHVGDVVHLYVPRTDIYLLRIYLDVRWPVLSAWFGYQVGRPPTAHVDDSGLSFHPSTDKNLLAELVFRAFSMLEPGMSVTDSGRRTWKFEPPFRFLDGNGERGEPAWPLEIPGDHARTRELQRLDPTEQVESWATQAGVEPTVFEIDWSSEGD